MHTHVEGALDVPGNRVPDARVRDVDRAEEVGRRVGVDPPKV